MIVVGQRSIQGDTKIFRVLNVLNLSGSKLYVHAVFCLRDMYLDGKHMIRSCLDLVAMTNDLSTGSEVQDQLRDLPCNQKMTHAGMLVGMLSDKYRLNSNGAKTLLRGDPLLNPRLSPRVYCFYHQERLGRNGLTTYCSGTIIM
jgi:hypothetical protein